MTKGVTNIVILGATGSIGQSTLEVINASAGSMRPLALSVHSKFAQAEQLAIRYKPKYLVVTDELSAKGYSWNCLPNETALLWGDQGIQQVVSSDEVDIVVSAIVGSAGLRGTWAALEAGKTVALANKETLVMAGPLVTKLAEERGGKILPVDSEHSAVFQALHSGKREEVKRVILTASGGPFLHHSQEKLSQVTVAEALAHPIWEMGPKISIDSATMMNKALEIIEARWLFDLQADQIEVVIHPQSIIHSMVEFIDGSIVAQISPPDMKLPIQYALTYPDRAICPVSQLDLTQKLTLEFEPPDLEKFPAIELGREVAQSGGTAGAVVNAANEAAVAEFLAGRLSFLEIVPACRTVLENHNYDPNPSLERLLELDVWAREEVARWVCT